jgi:hypothetical protein
MSAQHGRVRRYITLSCRIIHGRKPPSWSGVRWQTGSGRDCPIPGFASRLPVAILGREHWTAPSAYPTRYDTKDSRLAQTIATLYSTALQDLAKHDCNRGRKVSRLIGLSETTAISPCWHLCRVSVSRADPCVREQCRDLWH